MNKNFNNNGTNNNSNNNEFDFGGIVMMNGTITTKKDFVETVKTAMETMYSDGCVVRVQDVQKNNGMVLCGLTIQKIGVNIAPTIYLDSFYEEYRNGRTLVSIVNTISATYEQHKVEKNFSVDALSSFDSVKDKICFKLINAEKNQELLQDVPYVSFMDLAIVFYILVDQSVDGNATALVRNGMMQLWGNPDIKELYRIAKNNTQRRYKGRVSNMMEIMGEIISHSADNVDSDVVDAFFEMDSVYEDNMMPMFVATNNKKVNGAGVILYDGLLRTFAEKIGGDFYILPSSVHEVLFVPANGDIDARYLIQMVKEVNATEVSPDEVLSDNVYMYHADEDRLEMM
ncbi:MAG: DUF5688 family protein [Agathobacter sp.]|nr:DUF5688 family protein [Agathobacter sp.]